MSKVLKKKFIDKDVYEMTLERMRYCFKVYDRVTVSFSGGKDSTAVLTCALEVAKEFNRLPLKVVFFDEEAIHPPTIEYVERVMNMEGVDLEWYCLPFQHRNACSSTSPYWYCWHPEEKHLWVRELPSFAISAHPLFKMGMTVPEFADALAESVPNHCVMTGIRTQESLRRQRAVTFKKNDNYIAVKKNNSVLCHPIYDWSSEDVWKLVEVKGIDYNKTYDILNQTKLAGQFLHQRVCPPFGEQPLQGLWKYAECWPDMWAKMIERVPGVATAWRYALTELYNGKAKPEGITWRQYIEILLGRYTDEDKAAVLNSVNSCIKMHYGKCDDEIPEEIPHPFTGASWKFISMVAAKGDLKGRYSQGMLSETERTPEIKEFRAKFEAGEIYKGYSLKEALVLQYGNERAKRQLNLSKKSKHATD